uniref:Centromere protein H C-terminal domain-containing protein n=1 Tax=Vombatus ursinus TaxID=29139 RepID=A0A4X2LWP9_VOMUR
MHLEGRTRPRHAPESLPETKCGLACPATWARRRGERKSWCGGHCGQRPPQAGMLETMPWTPAPSEPCPAAVAEMSPLQLPLIGKRVEKKRGGRRMKTAIWSGSCSGKERPTEELAEGDLLQRIEDLERKMEGVKIELEMKTLALRRVQVAHALQKKLEKKDSESESILAILKNILTLNSSILKAQQQTRDLEEKMLEVKKKRLMFKKAGEAKLLEIQAENKKKKDELNILKNSALLTKMKKSLQKEIDSTTIIQNVFQHIVMAAKIDWAADPALKALILQLEKNLSFI